MSAGLPPSAQGVGRAGDEAAVCGATPAQALQLHVHRGGLGVSGALVIDEELLHDRREKLHTRLLLPGADEAGSADLVEHRRRALAGRRIQRVTLECVDRGQLAATVVAKLPGLVRPRDDGAVGGIQCRKSRNDCRFCVWCQLSKSSQLRGWLLPGSRDFRVARAIAIPIIQGRVVRVREDELFAQKQVDAPHRNVVVSQCVLVQIRRRAQTLRHALKAIGLLAQRVEHLAFQDRNDDIPQRDRGIRDHELCASDAGGKHDGGDRRDQNGSRA